MKGPKSVSKRLHTNMHFNFVKGRTYYLVQRQQDIPAMFFRLSLFVHLKMSL